jgi:hypothetical protein
MLAAMLAALRTLPTHPIAIAAAALLAAGATAQGLNSAGTALRNVANAFSRGGAGTGAGELLQRFDADEIRGFGADAAHPGMQVVHGVALQARDFGFNVPDGAFDVTLYTEDPLRPDHPDLANPLGTVPDVVAVPLPLGATFAYSRPPALAPVGRDVFVGVRVNPTTAAFGGLRLNLLSSAVSSTIYDQTGAGMPASPPEANSRRLFRDVATNQLTYLARGQYMLDLLVATPSGFPTALTNQASYPLSTVSPGTTSMLSGLHPDAASPPQNAGRADEVGFVFRDVNLAAGTPIVFAAAFADFGPVVPLATLVPGSSGALCLDTVALFPLGVELLAASEAWLVTAIAPTVRASLHGQSWTQQAIAFDLTSGTLHGSGCGKQRF